MRGSVVHDVTEQTQRSPAVAISNAIVQIYKEGYGKGATRARTRIDDDVIVVTLEDIAWASTGRHRFRAVLVTAFATLASRLAVV